MISSLNDTIGSTLIINGIYESLTTSTDKVLVLLVDSTMIPVCHSLRRYANKVFKGMVIDGKSLMG